LSPTAPRIRQAYSPSPWASAGRPAVCALHGVCPAARRLVDASFTAFWQDRSALNAWPRNIDSVSVRGNSRSRYRGNNDSTLSNNSGLVNRLKHAYASQLRAAARTRRYCCARASPIRHACVSSGVGWSFRNPTLYHSSSQPFLQSGACHSSTCHSCTSLFLSAVKKVCVPFSGSLLFLAKKVCVPFFPKKGRR
jgi:hypothetical protein